MGGGCDAGLFLSSFDLWVATIIYWRIRVKGNYCPVDLNLQ